MSRSRAPGGTGDLLELLAEVEAVKAAAQRAASAPAVAVCSCSTRGELGDGYTSPSAGLWVHAACGLPSAGYAAAMRTLPAPAREPLLRVTCTRPDNPRAMTIECNLTPTRIDQLRADGITVTPTTRRNVP